MRRQRTVSIDVHAQPNYNCRSHPENCAVKPSMRCSLLTSSFALLCCAYIALQSFTLIAAEPGKNLKQLLLSEAAGCVGALERVDGSH